MFTTFTSWLFDLDILIHIFGRLQFTVREPKAWTGSIPTATPFSVRVSPATFQAWRTYGRNRLRWNSLVLPAEKLRRRSSFTRVPLQSRFLRGQLDP